LSSGPRADPLGNNFGALPEFDRWLEADTVDALALQRPLPHDALRIVAKGEKKDRGPELQL
jgi:hypothetical protein